MCTVTFVASAKTTIITSNRDEQVSRPSLEPAVYNVNGKNLLFPKDPRAGGTWFATDEKANVLVLLNGADHFHNHLPPYRRSRGLIVLDLLSSGSAIENWDEIDLTDVEPFTIVLFQDRKLYQLRWNSTQKSRLDLDETKDYIWSSTTLYPQEVRDQREKWFKSFLESKPNPSSAEMLDFHRYTEGDDSQNGLVINREGIQLRTLSITQAVVEDNRLQLRHSDLVGNSIFENAIAIL
ncbi:MAG: hypothetical protein EOO51_11670 [Flavobacterium sp.]|nr:MAG: hypothetical protein EOO51_11670 [Flavobacterium sp.]